MVNKLKAYLLRRLVAIAFWVGKVSADVFVWAWEVMPPEGYEMEDENVRPDD